MNDLESILAAATPLLALLAAWCILAGAYLMRPR